MGRWLLRSLCLLIFTVTITVSGAEATKLKLLTTEELARSAEMIVVGRHIESRSVWIGRLLVTRVTVSVDELLKGEARSTVTVDILGGIDVNRKIPIGMTVAGAPHIHSGEQVLLFLSRYEGLAAQAGSNEYEIVGFSQGKFSVVEDPGGSQMVAGGVGQKRRRPLADVRAEIQNYLSNQTVRQRPARRGLTIVED